MQADLTDLGLLVKSRLPIIAVQSDEEARVIELFKLLHAEETRPLYTWTVTDGLTRLDQTMGSQAFVKKPIEVLSHIRSSPSAGVYLLLDFHPYLDDPTLIRLMKEIALNYDQVPHVLVLVSHAVEAPDELRSLTGRFELSLPNREVISEIVRDVARAWSAQNENQKVVTDKISLDKLISLLAGLTANDARSLAYQAIFKDGAICSTDMSMVMEAKYRLLDESSAITYHFEGMQMEDIAGLNTLKDWLSLRRQAFVEGIDGLERPKGLLLVGVQGCGKSLAAKTIAGAWEIPLLHLDMGSLYTKFFGESEQNLRNALKTAQAMAPCVLWIDELEKAVATGSDDGGTSKRMLGSLLTWMAENTTPVFIVATANDIHQLPAELLRKGRLDEIFFVDLPDELERSDIFRLHLTRRISDVEAFDLTHLASLSDGFSGAEIEQAIIASLYSARSTGSTLGQAHLVTEINQTRPLSVVMAEPIAALRAWAQHRTVRAN